MSRRVAKVDGVPPDRIICLRSGGWDVMVDGKIYGTWACRNAAKAGLEVEQRRADARRKLTGQVQL